MKETGMHPLPCPADTEHVDSKDACPKCGERFLGNLECLDDESLRCRICGTVYLPPYARIVG